MAVLEAYVDKYSAKWSPVERQVNLEAMQFLSQYIDKEYADKPLLLAIVRDLFDTFRPFSKEIYAGKTP